jgi:hypothetical protein
MSLALAAALVMLGGGAGAAPANVLIGTWQATTPECLNQRFIFTASSQTSMSRAIGPWPAKTNTDAVTYNVENPKIVWVLGSVGTGAPFYILGHDQMSPGNGRCEYRRVG